MIPGINPRLHKAMATLELREMDLHLQRAKQAPHDSYKDVVEMGT